MNLTYYLLSTAQANAIQWLLAGRQLENRQDGQAHVALSLETVWQE